MDPDDSEELDVLLGQMGLSLNDVDGGLDNNSFADENDRSLEQTTG